MILKERTKHRIKFLLIGIGMILGVFLLVPSPLCLIPHFCSGGLTFQNFIQTPIGRIKSGPETYVNVPGYLAWFSLSTWVVGMIAGVLLIVFSLKPSKYEFRDCPNCGTQTEQFQSGTKYKEGYKVKLSKLAELKANTVGNEYTCEECRRKHIVPIGT